MKHPMEMRYLLRAALAAAVAGAACGPASAQVRTYPQAANCLSPQTATQRQVCAMQRQPFYTEDGRNVRQPDARLEMNLDNGGGGTQTPVVPNTTGGPITSGGADGLGPSVD
ncbi:MAG TPA: hypothetical protein VHA35_05535 [Dongiaceae bacterium]|jgi:hypothetical protein|nr:hypothetical protein [Dongiaceae bacterium]